MVLLSMVIVPVYQLIVELYLLIHGMPKMMSSCPKSVMYYHVGSVLPLTLKLPSTQWVIVPC